MTLVEVIIAMTIFAVMAAAIFSVIAHANSTANRAKMRDKELSTQTNIIGRIGKDNNALTQLNVVKPNGYNDNYKVKFNVVGNGITQPQPIDGFKVYETDEGQFEDEFDFKLKSLVQTSSLTGLTISSSDLKDNEYLLKFTNTTSESVFLAITLADGYIFEGRDQYIHTSKTYMKTIPAGASADIGYCDKDVTGLEGMSVSMTGLVSNSVSNINFTTGSFASAIRTCEITMYNVPGSPKLENSRYYPTS